MSIQRYAVIETALCIGGNLHDGEVFMLRADAHDRELAALREELAECQKVLSYSGNEADAYGTAALHTELEDTQQRLTAAEQRNADAEKLLRETSAVLRGGECYGWENNQADIIDEFLKPTESGASE